MQIMFKLSTAEKIEKELYDILMKEGNLNRIDYIELTSDEICEIYPYRYLNGYETYDYYSSQGKFEVREKK